MDRLYVMILFGNACRGGVPASMTIKEFKAATKDSHGNFWIDVEDHKTNYVYGPANMAFPPDHFNLLSTYVEIVRPKLSPQTDKVLSATLRNK